MVTVSVSGAKPNLRSENMRLALNKFFSNESGATAIEYALMASLIAIALITALTNLAGRLSGEFSEISSALK